MSPDAPLRIAILSPGDRDSLGDGSPGRFADLFAALEQAGHHPVPAPYHDDGVESLRQQLLAVDAVLVWVNPIHDGRDRTVLDHMLRQVAAAGAFVSTHPDVIDVLGTKRVLFDTRELGWGCDTRLYRSHSELFAGLTDGLAAGRRVLKLQRGSSGDGVWSVGLVDELDQTVTGATRVVVRHAKRGSGDEVMMLGDFCDRWKGPFEPGGLIIDQAFQNRIAEGMVRCYLVHGRVAGFGLQAVNALIPAAPGEAAPTPGPRLYHPPTLPAHQRLKSQLETDWVPALCARFDLVTEQLPVLWDCDFLLGPPDAAGQDSYVLCEINVSSVAPYPESAVPYIVEAVESALSPESRHRRIAARTDFGRRPKPGGSLPRLPSTNERRGFDMSGPAEVWRQAADCFEAKLSAVGADQWDSPTGCGEWTVRELVDHALFWQANLGAVLGAGTSAEDGWPAIKAGVSSALADPSVLEGTVEGGPMNGMPKHQAMGLGTADVLLHSWDLARAIGADDTLPAEAVQGVYMGLSQVPEQMLRQPNLFAAAVPVPDDASEQDKLIGFAGRQP